MREREKEKAVKKEGRKRNERLKDWKVRGNIPVCIYIIIYTENPKELVRQV